MTADLTIDYCPICGEMAYLHRATFHIFGGHLLLTWRTIPACACLHCLRDIYDYAQNQGCYAILNPIGWIVGPIVAVSNYLAWRSVRIADRAAYRELR